MFLIDETSNIYRPAVEWVSFLAYLSAAFHIYYYPFLPLHTGLFFVAFLTILGLSRGIQAIQIIKMRRRLRFLAHYAVANDNVPFSYSHRLLGKGFEWKPLHAQRIDTLMTPEGRGYCEEPVMTLLVRKMERTLQKSPVNAVKKITKITGFDHWMNPFRPLPSIQGHCFIHGVGTHESDIGMTLAETNGHTLVTGSTRGGKTVFARYLINQDVARNDGPVIIWDPKGDAELMLCAASNAKKHNRTFYMLHLGHPDISARYNSVGIFQRVSEIATRVASGVAGEGNSAAFKEFTWRFVNIAAQAMVNMQERPTFEHITEAINNMDPLFVRYCEHFLSQKSEYFGWQEEVYRIETTYKNIERKLEGRSPHSAALYIFVERKRINDQVLGGLMSAIRYSRSHFDKLTASALPLLEKLTSGRLMEILAPSYNDLSDHRPIVSWDKVIRKNAVFYIGLDALSNNEVAKAFGKACFADFVSSIGYWYKHGIESGLSDAAPLKMPNIYGHADELSDLIGDQFQPLLSKAGGAGLRMCCYTQTDADVAVGLGSKEKAAVVFGNFNNIITFRVKRPETAELLTSQLALTQINRFTTNVSSAQPVRSDSVHDFRTSGGDQSKLIDTPPITPQMIMNLPKGHAFALVDGGKLFKIRVPYIIETDTDIDAVPHALKDLAEQMRQQYKTSESWWFKAE
ncbi:type IV conjugative transfer system coupling protein TraD [uncultured Shewanella sp.]|uniref:type IV conjugative transfer system coupling protein TraD n=1 Tax=uncultured Shewanella sp. TaxID=173975 RepID=UPI002626D581|nr:type IV conjugative transfer system coupling protein TraD [uncultured Shewanella sp.]